MAHYSISAWLLEGAGNGAAKPACTGCFVPPLECINPVTAPRLLDFCKRGHYTWYTSSPVWYLSTGPGSGTCHPSPPPSGGVMDRIKAPLLILAVVFMLSASVSTTAVAAATPLPKLPASGTPQ